MEFAATANDPTEGPGDGQPGVANPFDVANWLFDTDDFENMWNLEGGGGREGADI
jgi:hypothetical protein